MTPKGNYESSCALLILAALGILTAACSARAVEAADAIVLDTADPCSLLTRAQVETSFGKVVQWVKPMESVGPNCMYKFGEGNDLHITLYQGAAARNHLAVWIAAGQQGCDELIEVMFDRTPVLLSEKYPAADQSLVELPLSQMYRLYTSTLAECLYVHAADRPDAGANVFTSEAIFRSASANVAVLSDQSAAEFAYHELLPGEVAQALQQAADKEAFYAAAAPHGENVLAGYTEILLALLGQAAQ